MKEDWVQTDIENIFKKLENGKRINQGWSPQCKKSPSPSDNIWGVLKTTAIQKNLFWAHENKELPEDKIVRPHLEVKAGDILLTCAGPRNRCGIACTVIKTRPKLLLSGKMYRFRPDESVMTTDFLTFFLQTQEAWLAIDKMKTGSSDSGLNLTHARFKKLPVRIAPLPEQKAIVKKIEELFSSLDSGIADLKKAQDQLVIYRQAVLKKAFEGELTKEWRDKNEIKFDWENTTTGEVMPDISSGSTPKAEFLSKDGEIQFLKVYNLNFDGTLNDKKDPAYTTKEIHNTRNKRAISKAGDVLINIVGPPLGKTSMIPLNCKKEFNINQAIVRFRPNEKILSKFLSFFLQNPETINWLEGTSKATAGQYNVKVTTCRIIPISLPLVSEQYQIVQEIESRLSVCDKVETDIADSLEKAQALRQSILKKAFEGKLLSEEEIAKCKADKAYEPASVLLEKIKKEKNG
ncbi:type I restriction enzyme S subunit [Saonia flava]|uniref:Type I restriction enzyme S subunit n=1 Tax=Saonia flava TaxID=523696 RepID=A0A846QX88_9FLAO|nr:restriction endonuclease subunit S [Saonia flava]NJB69724.1 type I restriction enzyme S subunit [Saonia flava]